MDKHSSSLIVMAGLIATVLAGCVERKLTISTEPQGALITLNEQQVGTSPVTVSFNWYGNYQIRAQKDGYETLDTSRKLKAPLHDSPPFDFFAELVWPGVIVDSYEWSFDLAPKVYPTRDELIDKADALRRDAK